MFSVNWDTVVTAGATAVFVTLAIEYLAKPRLEARKERILEAHRARRDFSRFSLKLTVAARKYIEPLPARAEPKLQADWQKERERYFGTMKDQILRLEEEMDQYAGTYALWFRDLMVNYIFTLKGIMISQRPKYRKAEIIVELGVPMATILAPSIWHPLVLGNAVGEVKQRLAALQEESPIIEPTTGP